MTGTASALDDARDLIGKRLAELDEERRRLERALVELGDTAIGRPGRGPGRPRSSGKRARKVGRRPGRRKSSRAEQALKLVAKSPGITAPDIAKAMKINPNYLYRVLGDLQNEGRVAKKDREYFPGKKA